MATPPLTPTPQQQMLQAVKEYVTQAIVANEQKTMAAVNALGERLDAAINSGLDAPTSADPQARAAWLRETALRAAVDLYRGNDGHMTGTRADILGAAKAFEAFLGGTDAPAA